MGTRLADPDLTRLLATVCAEAGVAAPVPDPPPGLEVVRRSAPDGTAYLFLLNHADAEVGRPGRHRPADRHPLVRPGDRPGRWSGGAARGGRRGAVDPPPHPRLPASAAPGPAPRPPPGPGRAVAWAVGCGGGLHRGLPADPEHLCWTMRGRTFDFARQVAVMAIVNRTPDSFHDQGRTFALDAAARPSRQAVANGRRLDRHRRRAVRPRPR